MADDRPTKSGSIGSVELPHNLLDIRPWVSSYPITLVKVEKMVNVGDSVQAPCEDSALLCNNLGHLLFIINHLGIPIDFPLALDTPYVCLTGHWSRVLIPWYVY
ncbi:hypothetical protein H5410_051591 [Solanum commersonii]|uniref:Uncharacterized protein n=1 Tax=Solanum commersonii TaxID=4109 RepID=A0A9J5X102_SOLCO|nr:hypothetical protein H5410_051591 [Solanum commersonii]